MVDTGVPNPFAGVSPFSRLVSIEHCAVLESTLGASLHVLLGLTFGLLDTYTVVDSRHPAEVGFYT